MQDMKIEVIVTEWTEVIEYLKAATTVKGSHLKHLCNQYRQRNAMTVYTDFSSQLNNKTQCFGLDISGATGNTYFNAS